MLLLPFHACSCSPPWEKVGTSLEFRWKLQKRGAHGARVICVDTCGEAMSVLGSLTVSDQSSSTRTTEAFESAGVRPARTKSRAARAAPAARGRRRGRGKRDRGTFMSHLPSGF